MGYVIDPACCCTSICCNCTLAPGTELCADSGTVPASLTISVETGCGTFTGTLTLQANNCWKGIVSLRCLTQQIGNLGHIVCSDLIDICWLMCCGTDFPSVPSKYALFATCQPGCSGLGTPTTTAAGQPSTEQCSPFIVTYFGLPSIPICLGCTDDVFNVTITG